MSVGRLKTARIALNVAADQTVYIILLSNHFTLCARSYNLLFFRFFCFIVISFLTRLYCSNVTKTYLRRFDMDEVSLLKKRTSAEALHGNKNMTRNDNSGGVPTSKLKRSFSLKRDLMRNKQAKPGGEVDEDARLKMSMLRRPSSWNKVLGKMLQKMSYLGIQQDKGGLSSKYDAFVSRSSTDVHNENAYQPPKILSGDKVPGVVGLRNQGNTCFINAVLQCLSHTDVLAR